MQGEAELLALLEDAVRDGLVPGAVAAAGLGGEQTLSACAGQTSTEEGLGSPMAEDTLFDMASLTKVMVTLPAVLLLAAEGRIALGDPVARHLDEFATPLKASVRVEHLLTHTGGLRAHREYFRTLRGHDAIVRTVLAEDLEAAPGTRVEYSDLGFILLGEIVRRVTGAKVDAFARERIFRPLQMPDTGYLPRDRDPARIAATERLAGMRHAKVGVVHDDNAEAMGGVAGHAGLFSTVGDVRRYAEMWVDPGDMLLPRHLRADCLRSRTDGLNGRRGLGWALRGDPHDVWGDAWPPGTVGHTGYTGTSLVFDPESSAWAILLTNRVHLGRAIDIGPLRHRFHSLVARLLRLS